MYTAVRHLEALQGGLAVNDGQVLGRRPPLIGGLLSTLPAPEVFKKRILDEAAHHLRRDRRTSLGAIKLSGLAGHSRPG